MENYTDLFNISSLLMREVATTVTAVSTVRNTSVIRNVTSNAYEWRFILPPYFIIFMLSISGNCMVIATLANNRRMRTVTNVYLLNLAISDFLLGVFCLPFTLVGQVYRRFLFGAALCKLIPFVQAVSVSVDVWTLVAISLERYFAICRPLKSRKWQTQCHAYKMIATVWLMSLGLNSPILIVSTLQPMKGNAFKCREVWTSLELERTFNLGLDIALLLVPFFIMVFAYSLIVSKLWRGMRHEIQHNFNTQLLTRHSSCRSNHLPAATPILQGNSTELYCKSNWPSKKLLKPEIEQRLEPERSPQNYCMHTDLEFRHVVRSTHIDKSIEAKRKVIRMLFVIMMEFFVCWTPLHVINTIYLFYPEELYQYVGPKGIICLQLLAYCSSCCNPITYCFMNRKFRQAFLSLIKTCKLFSFTAENKSRQADHDKKVFATCSKTPDIALPATPASEVCKYRDNEQALDDCIDFERHPTDERCRKRLPSENGCDRVHHRLLQAALPNDATFQQQTGHDNDESVSVTAPECQPDVTTAALSPCDSDIDIAKCEADDTVHR